MQDLRSAILKAANFAVPHRGRDQSPLSGIRLIPKADPYPARVFALGMGAGILIDIEGDVPNLVVDAAGINAATRADPDAIVWLDGDLVAVGRYRFRPWCEVERFPGLPMVPAPETFQNVRDFSMVPLVCHAVGKDPGRPELSYVSFRPGFVEATDGTRLARIPAPINRTAQIHPDVFEVWNPGACEFAAEPGIGAVFRWPGEVRWGQLYGGGATRPYPNLALVPDDRVDHIEVVVPVDAFKAAVRKATSVSPVKTVACRFRPGGVAIASVMDEAASRIAAYEDKVPALCRGDADLVVNGTALVGALSTAQTPRVVLGLQGPRDAMVVRSGPYIEHIYPVVV